MIHSVIHIITTIERGGAEKQLLTLVRAQVKSGLRVQVVPLKGRPELIREFIDAGAIVQFDFMNKGLFSLVIKLHRLIQIDPASIVHAHLPRAEFLSRLALTSNKNAFVVSRHNAEKFAPIFGKFLSRFVVKRANLVIAISDVVRSFLLDTREVTSTNKIVTVRYAYDPQVTLNKGKRRLDDSNSNLRLITIGRLVPQKNYPFLFKSLTLAASRGIKFKLIILGSGNLETELKGLASDLGLSEKIDWLGKQSDIQTLMQDSDSLLMTSNYEGFGLVLLEAMQLGLPIIAPNISTFPEVLGEDYPGLFTPWSSEEMANLISQLYDKQFYSRLSNANLKRLKRFTPEEMLREITKCYEKASLTKLR